MAQQTQERTTPELLSQCSFLKCAFLTAFYKRLSLQFPKNLRVKLYMYVSAGKLTAVFIPLQRVACFLQNTESTKCQLHETNHAGNLSGRTDAAFPSKQPRGTRHKLSPHCMQKAFATFTNKPCFVWLSACILCLDWRSSRANESSPGIKIPQLEFNSGALLTMQKPNQAPASPGATSALHSERKSCHLFFLAGFLLF